jgi:hypothetical protein
MEKTAGDLYACVQIPCMMVNQYQLHSVHRNSFDRTLVNAGTAIDAGIGIDNGLIVFQRDCLNRAYFNAVPAARAFLSISFCRHNT